jgi:hypothetical protein
MTWRDSFLVLFVWVFKVPGWPSLSQDLENFLLLFHWIFFPGSTRVWVQDLVFVRLVLYHWSMPAAFFALVIFQMEFQAFSPQDSLVLQSSYVCLPCVWDYKHEQPHPDCLLKLGLTNFLPKLPFIHNFPDLLLLSSWNYRHESPCPAFTEYVSMPLAVPLLLCPWFIGLVF